jgi:hypothetical protein
MRDATAQRVVTMIPIGAMRQPSEPHVRHAEIRGASYRPLSEHRTRITDLYKGRLIRTASAAPC